MVERSTRERVSYPADVALHELSVSGLVVKNGRIPACLEDFSEAGMRVSSGRRLMPYTSVLCEISVGGVQVGAPIMAQVRWVERLKSGKYAIGLQFWFERAKSRSLAADPARDDNPQSDDKMGCILSRGRDASASL